HRPIEQPRDAHLEPHLATGADLYTAPGYSRRQTRLCIQTRGIPDEQPQLAARCALDLSLGVALRDRLALVVLALATAQPDLDLGTIAREVHAQRDERVALLTHLADEARDLLAVQKQLARAHRLVVHEVALGVRRDVHVLKPRLVPVDAHEAVTQVAPALADRLHLSAGQHHAGLVLLIYEVVVKRAAVDRHVALAVLVLVSHRPAPALPAPAACPAAGPDQARTASHRRGLSAPSRARVSSAASRLATAAARARVGRSPLPPSPTRAHHPAA